MYEVDSDKYGPFLQQAKEFIRLKQTVMVKYTESDREKLKEILIFCTSTDPKNKPDNASVDAAREKFSYIMDKNAKK